VLSKMEASAGGFRVLHESITDLVLSKADRAEVETLKRKVREREAHTVTSPLSVKCLSCHQALPNDPVKVPGDSLPVGIFPEARPSNSINQMRENSPPRRPGSAFSHISTDAASSRLSERCPPPPNFDARAL
jgi:hypothetical protein